MKELLLKIAIGIKDLGAKLFLAALAALAPIHGLMIAAGVIIFIDLITGIIRSHKNGDKVNSSGLRRTLTKIIVYQVGIISAFLFETYFLPDIPVIKIVAGCVAIVEAISIFENLNEIYGSNIFKLFLDKLGSVNDERKPRKKRKVNDE